MGGKKSILPSGYKQLEYIENTSTAYIDTGLYISNNMNIEVVFSYTALTIWGAVFGAQNRNGGQWFLRLYNSTLKYAAAIGNYYEQPLDNELTCELEKKYNVKLNIIQGNVSMQINNTTVISTQKVFTMFKQYVFLFAENGATKDDEEYPIFPGRTKIFKAKFSSDNELIRDYIPCINPNNVVGMYDTVEGQFYSSPNGTAFIAGPEV